ncbi:MAG: hypothetical protein ABI702_16810 [Burkholderiales bacterium]
MRISISFAKQDVLPLIAAVIASAMLGACGDATPPGHVQAMVAPEAASPLYFGAEYGSVQSALTPENAPQPQAF